MLLGSSPLCPPQPLGALAALAFQHKAGSQLPFSEEDDGRVARTFRGKEDMGCESSDCKDCHRALPVC